MSKVTERIWYSSLLEWRSVAHTLRCLLWFKATACRVWDVANSLSSTNTMLLLTDSMRKSTFWNDTQLCSYHQTFDPKQPRSKPGWLQHPGKMQQRVCQTKVHDMDELKQRLFDVGWHGFNQSVVDGWCNDEWYKRLRVCIGVKMRTFWALIWLRLMHTITSVR